MQVTNNWFNGKICLVTGSGQGIGEAYARALASQGATVFMADIKEDKAAGVRDDIVAAGGKAFSVYVDVAVPESVSECVRWVMERCDGIDCLINNAAIFEGMRKDSLLAVDYDYYRRFIEVNMNGALLMTRAAYQFMLGRPGASIVNQSSTAAYEAGNHYKIAKTGLNAVTIGLAKELGPLGIRVNGVAPGPVATPTTLNNVSEERLAHIVSGMPLQRLGKLDDIVDVCLFLLSDGAKWVTGQTWCVDGGTVLRI